MQVKSYDVILPTLSEFPQFFDMAEKPRELVAALIKVSVFKDGSLVGDSIPLEDAVDIATAISGLLSPK
jgi:hypothetical protein